MIFDRSGLAALSDLQTPEWHELFGPLENMQAEFLSHEPGFRSLEYKWPRDPLHNWSRCWEYPYVYHHLLKWRSKVPKNPRVVDVGSGVTFFPFAVARLGCGVSCVDIDPICERDLMRAACCVPCAPGHVNFRYASGSLLPFSTEEIDAVYCISVIEHMPDFSVLKEIHRILKPGGLFLLTFDLDLRGDQEIGPVRYRQLKEGLRALFAENHDETVHPTDILTSSNSLFPVPGQPFYLAVEGQFLRRANGPL